MYQLFAYHDERDRIIILVFCHHKNDPEAKMMKYTYDANMVIHKWWDKMQDVHAVIKNNNSGLQGLVHDSEVEDTRSRLKRLLERTQQDTTHLEERWLAEEDAQVQRMKVMPKYRRTTEANLRYIIQEDKSDWMVEYMSSWLQDKLAELVQKGVVDPK